MLETKTGETLLFWNVFFFVCGFFASKTLELVVTFSFYQFLFCIQRREREHTLSMVNESLVSPLPKLIKRSLAFTLHIFI